MKIQYRSNRNKSCHNPINMDTHVSQVIESKPQRAQLRQMQRKMKLMIRNEKREKETKKEMNENKKNARETADTSGEGETLPDPL